MLKLPEVAQRLGVSEKTARRYVKAGTIPSVFIGNAYRVREEDLEEYMRQARVAPKVEPRVELLPEWQRAVDNARHFRRDARDRMRQEITDWKAEKEEGGPPENRRLHLDAMGTILQKAHDVETDLMRNMEEGLDSMGSLPPEEPGAIWAPNAYWAEVQEASRLYGELLGMVQEGAGLSVRRGRSDEASSLGRHMVGPAA